MTARDVVPSAVEPTPSRGFLRRRRTDPAPPPPVAEVPVVAAAPVPEVVLARPAPAPVRSAEDEELLRAEETLLQAALRQAQVLEVALANEQHLRRQETEQLHAEIDLLRTTLAALNAEAVARQEVVEDVAVTAPVVPEQRQRAAPAAPASAEPDVPTSGVLDDGARRHGRRRSGREAGPA